MSSRVDLLDFRATSCGVFARGFLRECTEGGVLAVFKRSFYVNSGDRVACIGNGNLFPCPLNIVVDVCPDVEWQTVGIHVGMPWRIHGSAIYLDHGPRIRYSWARTWLPDLKSQQWCHQDLRLSLTALRRLAMHRVPSEGLGVLAFPSLHLPPEQAFVKMAQKPVSHLRQWLSMSMSGGRTATPEILLRVRPLMGLGPGLTPSGDDFLAGIMIALHAFGHGKISRRLWHAVRPWSCKAGNIISFAHLSAASEGQGTAPLHNLIAVLRTGDCSQMAECVDGIDNIGHTSGWDALAGVLTVADVILHNEQESDTVMPRGAAA